MGAAASIDAVISADSDQLRLQASAHWHRIINHAGKEQTNASSSESKRYCFDVMSVVSISGSAALFEALDNKGHDDDSLPFPTQRNTYHALKAPIQRPPHRNDASLPDVLRKIQHISVSLRLCRRSGNILALQWDYDLERMFQTDDTVNAELYSAVQYELIGKVASNGGRWQSVFLGVRDGNILAIRCSEFDMPYAFRCRRIIKLEDNSDSMAASISSFIGEWSAPVIVRSGPGPPSAPMGASLLNMSSTSVYIGWTPPMRDNGLPILGYTVEVFTVNTHCLQQEYKDLPLQEIKSDSPSGAIEGMLRIFSIDLDSRTRQVKLCAPTCPLQPSCSYEVRIYASNEAGKSASFAAVHVRTIAISELSVTPWALEYDLETHKIFYKHLESSSIAESLPAGAILDEAVSFANKVHHLRTCVQRRRDGYLMGEEAGGTDGDNILVISRDNVLADSLLLLSCCDPFELERKSIRISYSGEEGIDYGGLAKDWFCQVSMSALDPNNCLFELKRSTRLQFGLEYADHQVDAGRKPSLYVDESANISMLCNADNCDNIRAFGIFLGKALSDGRNISFAIDHILLKWMICGFNDSLPEFKDLCDINNHDGLTLAYLAYSDFDLYTGLKWVLDCDDVNVADLTFSASYSVASGHTDSMIVVDLIPDGRHIPVTMENRHLYVTEMFDWIVRKRFGPALECFLEGFHSIVPVSFLAGFSTSDLQRLFRGQVVHDISDIKSGAVYSGIDFGCQSNISQWLWEVLAELDQQSLSNFLIFCTGCPFIPILGLSPPLLITSIPLEYGQNQEDVDRRLLEAHTCFNQLVVPPYTSKIVLKNRLLYTLREHGGLFSLK